MSNNAFVRMAEDNAPFALVLYLALNPEAKLTSTEIRERFSVQDRQVKGRFLAAITNGLISYKPGPSANSAHTYTAGEALLKMRAKFTEEA
jgi:hypothetical protein